MINAEQVFKYFGNEPNRVTAVEDLNLTVETGAKIAIVGRSGSGKTTLLKRMLAGDILQPDDSEGVLIHEVEEDVEVWHMQLTRRMIWTQNNVLTTRRSF